MSHVWRRGAVEETKRIEIEAGDCKVE